MSTACPGVTTNKRQEHVHITSTFLCSTHGRTNAYKHASANTHRHTRANTQTRTHAHEHTHVRMRLAFNLFRSPLFTISLAIGRQSSVRIGNNSDPGYGNVAPSMQTFLEDANVAGCSSSLRALRWIDSRLSKHIRRRRPLSAIKTTEIHFARSPRLDSSNLDRRSPNR